MIAPFASLHVARSIRATQERWIYSPSDAPNDCSGPSHIGAVGLGACGARAVGTEWLGNEPREGAGR